MNKKYSIQKEKLKSSLKKGIVTLAGIMTLGNVSYALAQETPEKESFYNQFSCYEISQVYKVSQKLIELKEEYLKKLQEINQKDLPKSAKDDLKNIVDEEIEILKDIKGGKKELEERLKICTPKTSFKL